MAGAGSISKLPGGGWRITVSCGNDPITGKRLRKTKVVKGSKRAAERERARMLIDEGMPGHDMTLAEFFEGYYLPDARQRLRANTVHGYERKWHTFISKLGRLRLSQVTPPVINSWLARIEGDKRKFEAYKMLRQIMGKATRWDFIAANPCSRVEPPKKVQDYEPVVLTAEQARAYIYAFEETELEPVLLVALGAGLRRSEIVALDWGDITPEGKISVTHAVTSVAGKAIDDAPKSRFGVRDVWMPPTFMDRLNALRGDLSDPVAATLTGARFNPDNLSARYRELLRGLPDGVPRVPLKNLRHTSLTLALQGGADILAVSRRAGHSGIGITSRYYLRPSEDVDKAAAEGLGALL